MKHIEKYIGLLLAIIAVCFNLWIYRMEPAALVDPNDNTFQFALVERTSQIWSFAIEKCSSNYLTFGFCHLSFLVDHWVPNWAQGYNLPYYYSHIPQILIVASYRLWSLFGAHFSLFGYYHLVIYLLFSFFPLSLFLALSIIGLSPLAAGMGALVATHLSTDGLYGLDPASFLWRGYGLSSQLFAMVWLPLALAFAWKYFNISSKSKYPNSKQFSDIKSSNLNMFRVSDLGVRISPALSAILTLAATTAGHLGIGVIAFLSIVIMAMSPILHYALTHPQEIVMLLYSSIFRKPIENRQQYNNETIKQFGNHLFALITLFGSVGLLLGYWILPILMDGNYHNISVWDGIWKFDSFGYREVLKNLLNGDLFDFGRPPILTLLVSIGLFASLQTPFFPFALLFVFWILFYFGRTTWGGLYNLIPGMDEFHLSRFIVGVHISGLFLLPIGLNWVLSTIKTTIEQYNNRAITRQLLYCSTVLFLLIGIVNTVLPQTIRYAAHNDFLINRANIDYAATQSDVQSLISYLSSLISTRPGRVFAGRGGSWGKNFRIAETPMYMYLSTYGIPVILWLPETWSPNSDTEQYFSENNPAHYSLYNVRYVVTPADLPQTQIQPFWKPLESGETWKLYEVSSLTSEVKGSYTSEVYGYITTGIRPAIVSSNKEDFRSLIRLWMHSDYPTAGFYPELTFDSSYPKNSGLPAGRQGLPNFRMLDEVTYKVPDGSIHSLFSEVPRYQLPVTSYQLPKITSQTSDSDMVFKAVVEVPKNCTECLVILRQSFHPSWRVTIDGKPAQAFAVFPFYTAVMLENTGAHEVIFTYEPSAFKKILLLVALFSLGVFVPASCITRLK